MLNWIVWNRTVYLYKMDLVLINLQWLICHKTQTTNQPQEKKLRPPSEMKKNILFTILKLQKSDIWEIRHKTIKFKIWRNLNSFFICISAFMFNSKIFFWHKYKSNEQSFRI